MGIQDSMLNWNSILNSGGFSTAAPIPRVECRRDLPLSFAQEQLWFLAQMEGGSKAYQSLRGLHLQGELDRIALRQALNQVVARHEALRAVFTLVMGDRRNGILASTRGSFTLSSMICGNAIAPRKNSIA